MTTTMPYQQEVIETPVVVNVAGPWGSEISAMAGVEMPLKAVRSQIAPNDTEWSWAADLATLPARDEYALGETLAWIARELGLTLAYADPGSRPRIAGQTIIGLEGLNPTEALAAIVQIANLKTEISGDRLVVSD